MKKLRKIQFLLLVPVVWVLASSVYAQTVSGSEVGGHGSVRCDAGFVGDAPAQEGYSSLATGQVAAAAVSAGSGGIAGSLYERLRVQAATIRKNATIAAALAPMAIEAGLPKYWFRKFWTRVSEKYLLYKNFGELGLAEIGIAVRSNAEKLRALATGRPLIVIANHPLGIADGLVLQYLVAEARASSSNSPVLLYLARWVEKILPHAIYSGPEGWGTAIPVDISKPDPNDPRYDELLEEIKKFNSGWNRTALKILKVGGALIIFPAGHVAGMEKGLGSYPENVVDAQGSWMDGALGLARLGKADVVFAHVDSVNSEEFYRDRKRFGGGNIERVIWFFVGAIAKRKTGIDVYFSDPMSLDQMRAEFARVFPDSAPDPSLAEAGAGVEAVDNASRNRKEQGTFPSPELMRRYTYLVKELYPQSLDRTDLPKRK